MVGKAIIILSSSFFVCFRKKYGYWDVYMDEYGYGYWVIEALGLKGVLYLFFFLSPFYQMFILSLIAKKKHHSTFSQVPLVLYLNSARNQQI